jgi:hypothetical protein
VRLLRLLLVAAVLGGSPAAAAPPNVATLLESADPKVREAIDGLGASTARSALGALLHQPDGSSSRIDAALLGRLLGNPAFARHARRALPEILHLRQIDGIDDVVRRIAASRDPERIEDIAFELHAAAHLPVRALSAIRELGGVEVEVDAVLEDGTLVEMKNPRPGPKGHAPMQGSSYRQLALRAAGGRRVMLVVSRPLHPDSIARAREVVGPAGQLLRLPLDSGAFVPLDPASQRPPGRHLHVSTSPRARPRMNPPRARGASRGSPRVRAAR